MRHTIVYAIQLNNLPHLY